MCSLFDIKVSTHTHTQHAMRAVVEFSVPMLGPDQPNTHTLDGAGEEQEEEQNKTHCKSKKRCGQSILALALLAHTGLD